jgi:hypothetical protein
MAMTVFHFLDHKQIVVSDDYFMPLGSYGLPFSTVGPKTRKRVILIGNSVFNGTSMVRYMVKLKNHLAPQIEIVNFGMTGASVGDYVFIYNYIKKFDPDLIVVHFAPLTFGSIDRVYRSEAHKLLFTPEMKNLRTPQVLQTFTKDELIESFFYSLFPLYRKIHINRVRLKNILGHYVKKTFGKDYMQFFPFDLNAGLEERIFQVKPPGEAPQLPQAELLLKIFLDLIHQDRQEAVLILQETGQKDLPLCRGFETFIPDKDRMHFYDLRHHYKKENYRDLLHPNDSESRKTAARLLSIIRKHVDE